MEELRRRFPDKLSRLAGGFYDIKDKTAPKLLAFVRTHARGVHRFDVDESYAYISTEMDGFVGNILTTLLCARNDRVTIVTRKPEAVRTARAGVTYERWLPSATTLRYR